MKAPNIVFEGKNHKVIDPGISHHNSSSSKESIMYRVASLMTLVLCIVTLLAAGPRPSPHCKPHQPITVTWLGHAAFEVISYGGTNLLIDPFITYNPATPDQRKDLTQYKPSAILVTHNHGDHLGDALEISKKTGAPIIITYDQVEELKLENAIGCNIGGTITIGDVTIHVVPATHGTTKDGISFGYVLTFKDGRSLYHTGDTWINADMVFTQSLYHPDIVLTCAGGGPFTQDPETAAYEMRTILNPSVIIPMHYGTWPVLATENDVVEAFKNDRRLKIMVPGEPKTF